MNILVIGAGVLGSLYAARLQESGNSVTILARGKRLEEIRSQGILLEDSNWQRTCTKVEVIAELDPDAFYDLAIILVRKNQLGTLLPILSANHKIPTFLFMVNNCSGSDDLINAVGRQRVICGFPGAGGEKEGEIVRYRIINPLVQPTTIGEWDGSCSSRVEEIAQTLKSAGIPTAISSQMDAWLKTHVALVSPVANALYLAGGNNYRLACTQDGLVVMVRAIREGLDVLKSLKVPITPSRIQLIRWIPEPVLVAVLGLVFNTRQAELVMARHANVARDEMLSLADDFKMLARQTPVKTTAIDLLYLYQNPKVEPLPARSHRLALNWQEIQPFLWAAGLIGCLGLIAFRQKRIM